MSGKLKISLGILVLAAATSLWYFSSLFRPGTVTSAQLSAAALDTFSVFDDEDGDGLSNRDENLWRTDWQNPDTDGDGYLDGEEVLAGHNPRIPGPNDFLDTSKNLTAYASELLLGGILSGDISSVSNYQELALEQVADVVFEEYQKFSMAPRSINVNVVPDSEEAVFTYLVTMNMHWKETLPTAIRETEVFLGQFGSVDTERSKTLTADDEDNQELVAAALKLEVDLSAHAMQLTEVPVPRVMLQPHQNLIALLQLMAEQAAIAGELRDDPVKALIANTTLTGLIERTSLSVIYDYLTSMEQTTSDYISQSNE